MGGGTGGRTTQAYKTPDSYTCKLRMPTKTMWTYAELYLEVQEEVCFLCLNWGVGVDLDRAEFKQCCEDVKGDDPGQLQTYRVDMKAKEKQYSK